MQQIILTHQAQSNDKCDPQLQTATISENWKSIVN